MRKDFLLSQLVAVGALLATNVQALPAPSTLNDRERLHRIAKIVRVTVNVARRRRRQPP